MSKKREDQWLRRLEKALKKILSTPDMPQGDGGWLLARVKDTQRYSDHVRKDSLKHLVKDIARFEEEHPGLLPEDVLYGPETPEDEWLRRLTMVLKKAIEMPDAPREDAEQLLASIQDVYRWHTANVRWTALKDVEKDVARFAKEHAGVLPAELVQGPASD